MKQWALRIVIFVLLSLGIAAVQILLGTLVNTGGSLDLPQAPRPLDKDQAEWGRSYVALAQADDSAATRLVLNHLDECKVQAWVLDAAGREVAGREMPRQMRDLALDAVATGGPILRGQGEDGSRMLAASVFRVASGAGYVAVGSHARPEPPPMPPGFPKVRFGLCLIGAGVLLFLLLRGPRGLVREMRRALKRLAQGDASVRLGRDPVGRGAEYEVLAREFNAMADTLHATMQSQHRLIAEIIHDMHSPLSRLSLAVEMADPSLRGEARSMMERIRRDSRRLASLSDRLLALSRMGAQDKEQAQRKVDLKALAEDCVASLRLEAQGRGRSIEAELPQEPVLMHGDPDLLLRAMENGLRNALEYAPEGTAVRISLQGDPAGKPGCAVLSISDQGPGVASHELGLIFRPFFRAANAQGHAGDGLGLAIVQRAAVLHGGEARAENSAAGGLVLTIILDLNAAQNPARTTQARMAGFREHLPRLRRGQDSAVKAQEPRQLAAS